jgi:ketosteroid isomerase-like protein
VSEADIDVVRDQFAATNEQDFARAMELYAEDVTLIASAASGPGKSGTYEGKDAVGEWFGDWFRAFARGYHFEIHEIRELDSGAIFMRASHGGRGRLSGVEVQGETVYLYRVRDGKISQVGFYANPDEALGAAELPEWSRGETD